MSVKLELYRVFKEVAEVGNITAAAQALYISQSAVSQSIKVLEKKLNQDETYRKQYDIQGKQQLRPLSQVYFSGDQQIGFIKSRDRVALYLAGSIAIAILVIACFNYINISMTKSL